MVKHLELLLFLFCFAGCHSLQPHTGKHDLLQAGELQAYGRSILNDKKELELISSGVYFGFTFQGDQCQLYATHAWPQGHGYLQYVLDGVYQKRVRIEGDGEDPLEIRAAGPGKHTVWIYKATEANSGAVVIQKIVGKGLSVLKKSNLPLIEFIGNSITCGAAADASEIKCGQGDYHDQHNAYHAYGPRVARALETSFILSSVSGVGIYRNWNSDGPVMEELFDKTDFQQNSSLLWDFSTYEPKLVSIALGTNDMSSGDGIKPRLAFDSAKFVAAYIKFVKLVKAKYPKVIITLLSSPMLNGSKRETLQQCLRTVKKSIDDAFPRDRPVDLFFFKPMQARGCTGHPSVEDHALLAEELIPFFKKYL